MTDRLGEGVDDQTNRYDFGNGPKDRPRTAE